MPQDKSKLKTAKDRSAKAHVPPAENARPTGSTRQNPTANDTGEYGNRGNSASEKK